MLRILLTIVLPLILPFLVYGLYLTYARSRPQPEGAAPAPEPPWTWIVGASVALLAATLITLRLMSGADPGARIEPPRLIDGKVQPSHVVD